MPYNHMSAGVKAGVITARHLGKTWPEICSIFQVHPETIRKWYKRVTEAAGTTDLLTLLNTPETFEDGRKRSGAHAKSTCLPDDAHQDQEHQDLPTS
ncbi:MAG: hypothetical protein M1816_008007 [Peltula sp. TS41687]|nr:MAG: hypothetical protein M1816_008007 [Peltula sp. TS41687]